VTGDHTVSIRGFDFRTKPGRARTYVVPPRAVATFRDRLAVFRPTDTSLGGTICPIEDRYKDLRYGLSDYDIRWSGDGSVSRLKGCRTNEPLSRAVEGALLDVGVSPYGGRADPALVPQFRECLARTGNISC